MVGLSATHAFGPLHGGQVLIDMLTLANLDYDALEDEVAAKKGK